MIKKHSKKKINFLNQVISNFTFALLTFVFFYLRQVITIGKHVKGYHYIIANLVGELIIVIILIQMPIN